MRLSGLRLPNYACALFLVPFLASRRQPLLGPSRALSRAHSSTATCRALRPSPTKPPSSPRAIPARRPSSQSPVPPPLNRTQTRGRYGSRHAKTRQSRLSDPGQCRQVAAGDDGVRRRHREIPLAGVHRLARLFHAVRELHGVFHEQDLVQQAVGQRSHAARDLLHQGWARHPWQRKRRSSAAPLLMAACALHRKMPRRSSIWSRQTAWRIPRWSLPASRPEARQRWRLNPVNAIATPTRLLGATIHHHVVSSVGSGAPAGVQATRLRHAIASSAGAGSKGPAGITRVRSQRQ